MKTIKTLIAAALAAAGVGTVHAQIQITEWMYNGANGTGEYVELTNLGSAAVDLTGWSFDDASRTPGSFSLSSLGLLGAGQTVVISEADGSDFRAAWGLPSSVRVAGGNTHNLGRADELNIYDAQGRLVDRLTYGDVTFPGTLRAQNFSGNPMALSDLEPTEITANWVLAAVGDRYGSYASSFGDVGSPGVFALTPVPEPASWALLLAGGALIAWRRGVATHGQGR
jgi:predicted extracellular nuclease